MLINLVNKESRYNELRLIKSIVNDRILKANHTDKMSFPVPSEKLIVVEIVNFNYSDNTELDFEIINLIQKLFRRARIANFLIKLEVKNEDIEYLPSYIKNNSNNSNNLFTSF